MGVSDWRPTCTLDVLQQRAVAAAAVRHFFAERDVLEVQTPVLSQGTGTDPALDPLITRMGSTTWYLQTSPEFHLKRLLAAGAPDIYRFGPVFRAEEAGRQHNPEFTMLEWYRLGVELDQLMDEVAALVDTLLGSAEYRRVAYADLVEREFGVGPDAVAARLNAALDAGGVETSPELAASDAATLMELAFATACARLEPGRVFVTEYPANQAALARTEVLAGREVARRFELIIDGLEIANGYDELCDAQLLARRAAADRVQRRRESRPSPELDKHLLAAQRHGLPPCAGVAVGFDRLLMLMLGVDDIGDVMPFSAANA
ncbi:MAG: EF-P lysine aminoacylase GenX [Gammaproteobacteria bacterium]|nr:MAG: EF-P lysine aminoacylase GenX [Gammaproteobacteria bacterium]